MHNATRTYRPRSTRLCLVAAIAALIGVVTGCSVQGVDTDSAHGGPDDPAAFVDVSTRHLDFDYEPLATPAEAAELADLVIVGWVGRLTDGPVVRFPEYASPPGPDAHPDDLIEAPGTEPTDVWIAMTTMWVTVEEVIVGDTELEGTVIPVDVQRSPVVEFSDVSEARFEGRGLFILDDMSGWAPFDGAIVEIPSERPDDTMYQPFADGVLLEAGGGEVVSMFADASDLIGDWGLPNRNLDAVRDAMLGAVADG